MVYSAAQTRIAKYVCMCAKENMVDIIEHFNNHIDILYMSHRRAENTGIFGMFSKPGCGKLVEMPILKLFLFLWNIKENLILKALF